MHAECFVIRINLFFLLYMYKCYFLNFEFGIVFKKYWKKNTIAFYGDVAVNPPDTEHWEYEGTLKAAPTSIVVVLSVGHEPGPSAPAANVTHRGHNFNSAMRWSVQVSDSSMHRRWKRLKSRSPAAPPHRDELRMLPSYAVSILAAAPSPWRHRGVKGYRRSVVPHRPAQWPQLPPK